MSDRDGSLDLENQRSYTYTWYGRGLPYTAEECERRVRGAFIDAASAWPRQPIYFSADEDAFFTPIPDSEPVTDVDQAVRRWWDSYGSSMTQSEAIELGYQSMIDRFGTGMLEVDQMHTRTITITVTSGNKQLTDAVTRALALQLWEMEERGLLRQSLATEGGDEIDPHQDARAVISSDLPEVGSE